MTNLFSELKIKDVTFANRIACSPMCQYSAVDGAPNHWHLVHLGSRAIGGAGLVIVEATAVEARGRISPDDTGIYSDAHIEAWKPITTFIHAHRSVAGIQLAHAGRKAGTLAPWKGGGPATPAQGGWEHDVVSSVNVPFDVGYPVPKELSQKEIADLISKFKVGARRALDAGFRVVEIHAAHGYLIHQFLSPLCNTRTDEYGGSFENRIRFLMEIVAAVKSVWPERLPLFVRLSGTDWVENAGWDIDQSVELSKKLRQAGVDVIDMSSGGIVPKVKIPVGPGYQVDLATSVKNGAGIVTSAVGMITEALQGNEIIVSGKADMIMLARELLRDPYWPRRAAKELGFRIDTPAQYERAW